MDQVVGADPLASSYRTLRLQPCYDRRPHRVEDRFSSDDGCGRDIARDNGATMRLIHQCDNVRAHKLAPSKLFEWATGLDVSERNFSL